MQASLTVDAWQIFVSGILFPQVIISNSQKVRLEAVWFRPSIFISRSRITGIQWSWQYIVWYTIILMASLIFLILYTD